MPVVKIDPFAGIGAEIKKKIHGAAVVEVFVFPVPDCPGLPVAAVHAPEERSLNGGLFAEQEGHQIDPIEGDVAWEFPSSRFDKGRGEVHRDACLIGLNALAKDCGPAHETRHADASLPERGLVVEKWLVVRPSLAAVVTGKNEEGVFDNASFFEFVVDHADTVIDSMAEEFAEILVKSPIDRVVFVLVSEMPLAECACGVTEFFQKVGERLRLQRKTEGVEVGFRNPLAIDEDFLLDLVAKGELDPEPLLPASSHEPGPSGSADGSVCVKVSELNPVGGDAVDVRGSDVVDTGAAKIAVAHVIDEDEDDVRESLNGRGLGGD